MSQRVVQVANHLKQTWNSYPYKLPIQTRWMDNDLYAHVNNVVYYSYFDTVINHFLAHRGKMDPATARTIGIIVSSNCVFKKSLSFPECITAGLRVSKIGKSSVEYDLAIFSEKQEWAAGGKVTHVFVDRETMRPRELDPIPSDILEACKQVLVSEEAN